MRGREVWGRMGGLGQGGRLEGGWEVGGRVEGKPVCTITMSPLG